MQSLSLSFRTAWLALSSRDPLVQATTAPKVAEGTREREREQGSARTEASGRRRRGKIDGLSWDLVS